MSTSFNRLTALFLGLTLGGSPVMADLPGQGVVVQPLQSSIAEETFQTLLVAEALKKLGFEVRPTQEIEYVTGYVALANGDGTFMANS